MWPCKYSIYTYFPCAHKIRIKSKPKWISRRRQRSVRILFISIHIIHSEVTIMGFKCTLWLDFKFPPNDLPQRLIVRAIFGVSLIWTRREGVVIDNRWLKIIETFWYGLGPFLAHHHILGIFSGDVQHFKNPNELV